MITKGFMIQSYLPHTVFMAPLDSLELIDPRINPPFDALSVETLGRGYLAVIRSSRMHVYKRGSNHTVGFIVQLQCSSENRRRQKGK